jgi:hypothetical protein
MALKRIPKITVDSVKRIEMVQNEKLVMEFLR